MRQRGSPPTPSPPSPSRIRRGPARHRAHCRAHPRRSRRTVGGVLVLRSPPRAHRPRAAAPRRRPRLRRPRQPLPRSAAGPPLGVPVPGQRQRRDGGRRDSPAATTRTTTGTACGTPAARVGTDGWTAELFIPWQTLRYRRDGAPWGINVGRYLRAENEEAMWRGWSRQQGLLFLDQRGLLTGIGPLPARRLTEWRPYVAGSATDYDRDYLPDGTYTVSGSREQEVKAGLDGKMAVAPTLTLDLTANTDFAQVEVDQQVVNLYPLPGLLPGEAPLLPRGERQLRLRAGGADAGVLQPADRPRRGPHPRCRS